MSKLCQEKKSRYRQVADRMKARKIQKDKRSFQLCRENMENWGIKAGIGKPSASLYLGLDLPTVRTPAHSILSNLVQNIKVESHLKDENKQEVKIEKPHFDPPKDIILKREVDKYKRRCIRNRESARASRLRKQQFVEGLEKKLKQQELFNQWLKDLIKCQSENMAPSEAIFHVNRNSFPFIEQDKHVSSWQQLTTLIHEIV